MASFWKSEACGQTVLPEKSVLIGQKLVENAKIQNFKCDILSNFQTMCQYNIVAVSLDFYECEGKKGKVFFLLSAPLVKFICKSIKIWSDFPVNGISMTDSSIIR